MKHIIYYLCLFLLIASFYLIGSFNNTEITNVAFAYENSITEAQETENANVFSINNSNNEWPYYELTKETMMEMLNYKYPYYDWIDSYTLKSQKYKNRSTKDISNGEPIEMQGYSFSEQDVLKGLALAKEIDNSIESSYGGCGPIALIGVLDYFSRTLGYTEIINNPEIRNDRIDLAKKVFLAVKTIELIGDATLTMPDDYVNGFNNLMNQFNLGFQAKSTISPLGGDKAIFVNKIKTQINKGIPVTLCVGALNSKKGSFAGHCVTIYAYNTWLGKDKNNGEIIEYVFFQTRLNYGRAEISFAAEDLLNMPLVALIEYNIPFENSISIRANDFANIFVNSNGQGQYFFDEKAAELTLANGYTVGTVRLRCSYIEDQFLVISGNRKPNQGDYNGIAYLEFNLNDNIKMIEFEMGLWSANEGFLDGDYIAVEYKKGNSWYFAQQFYPKDMTTSKTLLKTYCIRLKYGTKLRFLVKTNTNSTNRNKGRVVFDNIKLYYH